MRVEAIHYDSITVDSAKFVKSMRRARWLCWRFWAARHVIRLATFIAACGSAIVPTVTAEDTDDDQWEV